MTCRVSSNALQGFRDNYSCIELSSAWLFRRNFFVYFLRSCVKYPCSHLNLSSQRSNMISQEIEVKEQLDIPITFTPERERIIREIARALESKPFRPHPLFSNGHAQTLAGHLWPRRRLKKQPHNNDDEARLFDIEPGVQLLAHCRWQPERHEHPTVVLIHGMEGDNTSIYILGTAEKAYGAGFNVLRLNMRNCGATEHLTPTLYHSGMSGDMRAVLRELSEHDSLRRIFLVGFSMSGNIVLKLAGEEGEHASTAFAGVCAISPSLDLHACAAAIERPSNWIYQSSFIRSLQRRMRVKHRLQPDRYDITGLRRVRTIRDFDERFTARHGGFIDANDYYTQSSALNFIRHIRIPTLIIHAQDDPFIPFESFRHPDIKGNPNVILLAPESGGHVAFVGAQGEGEDRFWSENRCVEFCRLVDERLAIENNHS